MPDHSSMATIIDGAEIQGMARHWLSVPAFGYLGSSYGRNVEAALFKPLAAGRGDDVVNKLKADVPALAILPAGSVNLFAAPSPTFVDRLTIGIGIGGNLVLPEQGAINGNQ